MRKNRKKQLAKNFTRMLWIKAFLNFRFMNSVIALFYLHRGITLAEIYYLSLFWATGALLFEIPSSYLADKWGRKKTIILGIVLTLIYLSILVFAHGFLWLAVSIFIYGASYACMTGTDEALIYDTERELNQTRKTLGKLGKYRASRRFFKIFTAVIGAWIAKDLLPWQFVTLIGVDTIGVILALIMTLRIVEPRHKMDVKEQEAGVMTDAIDMLRIINKELVFFAFFLLWTYYQKFYLDMGVPVVHIGIFWGFGHLLAVIGLWYTGHINLKERVEQRINRLNVYFFIILGIYLGLVLLGVNPYILFFFFILCSLVEDLRFPLFAEYFNKKFNSYNRATTLSLSNLVHSVAEYPILFLAGLLIDKSMIYPFYLSVALIVITLIFLRLPYKKRRA